MARIRSIKPDFFTSEKIATLPLSARLLFIGLWTHVDDNGVAPDNEKLINAAVWPLEDDPRESLLRTREDLRRLSTAGLVVRYEASGKALLCIRNWDEHQKVSHPAKPRYESPTDEQIRASQAGTTSGNTPPDGATSQPSGDSPEDLGKPREILAPEQGAGSREQGAGSREVPPPAGAAAPPLRVVDDWRPTTTDELIADWLDHIAKRPPAQVIGQVGKLVKQMLGEDIAPSDVRAGIAIWASKGLHPSALPSVVNEVMNATPRMQRPPGNGPATGHGESGPFLPPQDYSKVRI